MPSLVQADELGGALKNTAALLTEDILASALSKDDKRWEPAATLIVRAVWKGYWEAQAENPNFELDANGVADLIGGIEGRVLTVLEGVFPAGQQCEALKSLARQEAWNIRQRVNLK